MQMAEGFAADLISLAADREVRGIIISGQGKAFCAGGDLKWALAFPQDLRPLSCTGGTVSQPFWRSAACQNRHCRSQRHAAVAVFSGAGLRFPGDV